MTKTLSHIGEFGLIEYIRKNVFNPPGVIKGIGDDTAVLDVGAKEWILLTTDTLVEGVHFKSSDVPEWIGHKALACNISDIAAMGGLPSYCVISLAAPKATRIAKIEGVFKGIRTLAGKYAIGIVGGDTVKARQLVINVALLGKVIKKNLVMRSGAKKGDHIFVTGPLGRSWEAQRHLRFEPRLKQARYLADHVKPSAMIDISDGLAADLGHILNESRVGAEIVASQVPLHGKATIKNALYDGEDFELIFTLPHAKAKKLKACAACPFVFYEIGLITGKRNKLSMLDTRGLLQKIKGKGFEHF